MMDAMAARENMVAGQLSPNQVRDPLVLQAMCAVPREAFVPGGCRTVAYADADLPLGNGRFLAAPLTIGQLLQIAAVRPGDVVLDVACANGYTSAVLSKLAGMVVGIEADEALVQQAEAALAGLGIDNVAVLRAEPSSGCPRQAPFDRIFIAATLDEIPYDLCHQLTDGGRLVMGLRMNGLGRLVVVERTGDSFGRQVVFDTNAPPLSSFKRNSAFVF